MRGSKNLFRSDVAKHFVEFFLEADSNFERVNLDSSTVVERAVAAPIREHSSIGRRQPATLRCWLALHRFAGTTSSGDGRTVSTRHSRGVTRQMPRPKPPTASQRRKCWSHWQTTTEQRR